MVAGGAKVTGWALTETVVPVAVAIRTRRRTSVVAAQTVETRRATVFTLPTFDSRRTHTVAGNVVTTPSIQTVADLVAAFSVRSLMNAIG